MDLTDRYIHMILYTYSYACSHRQMITLFLYWKLQNKCQEFHSLYCEALLSPPVTVYLLTWPSVQTCRLAQPHHHDPASGILE